MKRTRTSFPFLTVVAFACASLASAASCSSGEPAAVLAAAANGADASVDSGKTPPPPSPPAVYVAKVKNLLVGLPPTDDEVKAVVADPSSLRALVDGWMGLPQYRTKMLRFFQLAFQQTQVSLVDFADQTFPRQALVNATSAPFLVQNLTESFARTMTELVAEGRPFHEAVTTQRFMMTPALMEFYAFLDAYQVDDAGKVTDRVRLANPNLTVTVTSNGPIPLSETLDSTSPNYMHWYDPDVGRPTPPYVVAGCIADPFVRANAGADTLHYLLYGSLVGFKNVTTGVTCGPYGGTAAAPQITGDDFTKWKMVTVRPPGSGEATTKLWDLPTLRSSTELVLQIPRVGFFSTPAFFANWQTNTSNQARVTTNQTLIVALGSQVDGTDLTQPTTTPGLDPVHSVQPGCETCHQTLDPTRSILASTYSWHYHGQTETAFANQKGLFAFRGVMQPVQSVGDLATALAQHPLFAPAWVQKLCYYANSEACETSDPEFLRLVTVFKSSGFSWTALVGEFFASPLTTNAVPTQTTTDDGETIAVSRRDHLCAALNARLGFSDICSLDALTADSAKTVVPQIVSGLPSDGYGRGAVAPVLPNAPTLFYRAGTENICEAAAAPVSDAKTPPPGVKQWSSAQPDAAIADFIAQLMALTPSDPRAAQAQSILKDHFTAAVAAGQSATSALQSTFVAACLAPSSVSIGL